MILVDFRETMLLRLLAGRVEITLRVLTMLWNHWKLSEWSIAPFKYLSLKFSFIVVQVCVMHHFIVLH